MRGVFRRSPNYAAPQLYRPKRVKKSLGSLFDPAFEQQVTIGTLSPLSPLFGHTPAVTTGDYWIVPLVTTPGGYSITASTDGTFSYNAAGDTTRQQISTKAYDVSVGAFFETEEAGDYFTVYVNNVPPVQLSSIPAQQWYTGIAINPVIYADHVSDADDLDNTLTYTGSLPTGLFRSLATYNAGTPAARTVWQIQGVPGLVGSGALSTTVTDPPGDTLALGPIAFTITASVNVPIVVGTPYGSSEAAIEALGLGVVIVPVLSATFRGLVTAVSPAEGTAVVPGSTVTLSVSGVTVPALLGLTEASATAALTSAGLTPVVTYVTDGSSGTVYTATLDGQVDAEGELVLPGALIYLEVTETAGAVASARFTSPRTSRAYFQ